MARAASFSSWGDVGPGAPGSEEEEVSMPAGCLEEDMFGLLGVGFGMIGSVGWERSGFFVTSDGGERRRISCM